MAQRDSISEAKQILAKYQELDDELKVWRGATRKQMLFKLKSLTLREKLNADYNRENDGDPLLEKTVRTYRRKKEGVIDSVGFSFARKGIWLEHGVGRGRPKGSLRAKAMRAKFKTPWIKPTIDDAQELLNDIIAEKYADIVESEIIIRVPGIEFKNGSNG